MRFLCVGYGSIGKRHTAILREMGHEVLTVDPRSSAGADCAEYTWPDEQEEPDGILDCTPPDVRAGWSYPSRYRFIEKPLGALGEFGEHWRRWAARSVMMGFNYYWLPSLRKFVDSLMNVRVYALSIVGGQWLPDWHDGDYRNRYHGTQGRGGVVLDSLPHSLFIARWILGDVEIVGSVVGKLSGLDINTEDTAAVLLRALTGQPCYLLVDYLRNPRGFWIEAVTSDRVKQWIFDPNEADEMYHRQMEVFCQVAVGERQYGCPDLNDGIAVQRLIDEVSNK